LTAGLRLPLGRVTLPLLKNGFTDEQFAEATRGKRHPSVVVQHDHEFVLVTVSTARTPGEAGTQRSGMGIDAASIRIRQTPRGPLVDVPRRMVMAGLRQPVSLITCSDTPGHIYSADTRYTTCPKDGTPMKPLL
jgi:hypothetical protein